MTLLIDRHRGDVSPRVTYLSASSPARPAARASKAKRLNDTWAHQVEGQIADLKRRFPILKRLIADCDRLAGDLDQEVGTRRTVSKFTIPRHSAYSTYAKATALRRDNLKTLSRRIECPPGQSRKGAPPALGSRRL